MNIKNLFDPEKRSDLLCSALNRIRAKKGGEYPFAFAKQRDGAILVVDCRNKLTAEKLMKQMRKQRPIKIIVGKARLNGRVLEFQVSQKKGTVKAKDIKAYLAKSGLPFRKAEILDGVFEQNTPD